MTFSEFITQFVQNALAKELDLSNMGVEKEDRLNEWDELDVFLDQSRFLTCDVCPLKSTCPHTFACCTNHIKANISNKPLDK